MSRAEETGGAAVATEEKPLTAVERLRLRQERAEQGRKGELEQHAERTLVALDLLEAHVAEHGAATIPPLGKDKDGNPDPRDPALVFAQRLGDHPEADIRRGFEELKKAAVKYGRKVALVPTGAGMFVVRFPGDHHYKRFFNLFSREGHKAEASELMAVAASVSPPPGEAAEILRKNAALCYQLADTAVGLGGVVVDPK